MKQLQLRCSPSALTCEGLTCHQSRPFTMASCSRDSTVRLWSLTPLISPLLLNVLTEQPWEKVIGNTGEVLDLQLPAAAAGITTPAPSLQTSPWFPARRRCCAGKFPET